MSDFIEKLGIEPIAAYDMEIFMIVLGEWCQKEPVRELEKLCNEMLEALIEMNKFHKSNEGSLFHIMERVEKVIQKVDSKHRLDHGNKLRSL